MGVSEMSWLHVSSGWSHSRTSAVTAWNVVPEDRAFIDAPPDAFPRGTALFRYYTAVRCTVSVACVA